MKIAAYCRVSTAKEEQLESLKNQELFFDEFSKKNNYTLIKIYADEGISGKQMKNRTQFMKMLEDAKNHAFDMVVVKDISRFSRNTVDFLQSIRQLKDEGVNVQFLSTNQTILGDSEFVLTVFSALAQEESANLSKRVRFGMNLSAKKGKVPVTIYGYNKIGNHELEINEVEANAVKHIFDLYVNQGYGTRKIGFILDNEHIFTKYHAKHWTPRTIRRIIMNPIYCGILENHKSETVDFLTNKRRDLPQEQHFFHDKPEYKIISKDIWDKAQTIMKERENLYRTKYIHTTGHYSNRHLFSSLIKCEHCGYSFCRRKWSSQKSGDVIYWRCSGNNNGGIKFCDNNINVYEEDLIEQLKLYLNNIIKNKDIFVSSVIQKFNKEYKNTNKYDFENAKKSLEKLNTIKEKYKVMFANDIISIDELKTKTNDIESQKTNLQKEIELNAQIINKLKNKNSIAIELLNKIEQFLSLENWTNTALREIIDRITVNKNGTITFYLKY